MKPKIIAAVYILTCAVHFIAVIAVMYDPCFALMTAVEFVFYIIRRGRLSVLAKMIIVSAVIGCINIFVPGGRIVCTVGAVSITEFGLRKALGNAALVLGLFLFTGNFFSERVSLGQVSSRSLAGMSLSYFRYLTDIVTKSSSVRNIVKKIIVIYKRGLPNTIIDRENSISVKFIIYNTAAIVTFALCVIFLVKK